MPKGVKGFAKGRSGNPGGRPAKTKEEYDLIAACKAKTPDALSTIVRIMEEGESERNRLASAKYIIDRAYGKAVQQVAGPGENGEHLMNASITVTFKRPDGSPVS